MSYSQKNHLFQREQKIFFIHLPTLILLALHSIIATPAQADTVPSVEEIEIRLTLCNRSEQHFLACTFLINQLLSYSNPPIILATQAQIHSAAAKVLADFGPLKIIYRRDFQISTFAEAVKSIKDIFYSRELSKGSFSEILHWVRNPSFKKLEESPNAPLVYLRALNEWLHAFDLHAHFLLYDKSASSVKDSFLSQTENIQDGNNQYIIIRPKDLMDENGCESAKKEIIQIQQQISGVLLDLRNNPGGRLDEARCWAEIFLKQGSEVFASIPLDEEFSPQKGVRYTTLNAPLLTEIPLVVLQNGSTKSMAEVLAAGLREKSGAWILGSRSFGKWTEQDGKLEFGIGETFSLTDPYKYGDKIRTFSTKNYLYLPSGISFQQSGVVEDIEVLEKPDLLQENPTIRENFYFPLALPNKGKAFIQTRAWEITALHECISQGKAKERYREQMVATQHSDYQELVALDALNCLLHSSKAH